MSFNEMKNFLINAANAEDSCPRYTPQSQQKVVEPRHKLNAVEQVERLEAMVMELQKSQVSAIGRGGGGGDKRGGGGEKREVVCHKCGVAGHYMNECTSTKDVRQCYNCRELGHLSAACKKPRRPRGSDAPAPAAGKTSNQSSN
jgi:hypothetical protein